VLGNKKKWILLNSEELKQCLSDSPCNMGKAGETGRIINCITGTETDAFAENATCFILSENF
jgi:hypothetical protein